MRKNGVFDLCFPLCAANLWKLTENVLNIFYVCFNVHDSGKDQH